MAGFGPVGSFPVAALPSGGSAGVNYTPGNATITFQGLPPTSAYSFLPSRAYGLYVEVLNPGLASVRAYSQFVEVLHPGKSDARVYEMYVEVLSSVAGPVTAGGDVCILW